jgi:hypothetical protein
MKFPNMYSLTHINKPKHPLPPKREENKEQNERVWCLFLTRRANKILLATKAIVVY